MKLPFLWTRLRVRVKLQPIQGQFRFQALPIPASSKSSKNGLGSGIDFDSGLGRYSPNKYRKNRVTPYELSWKFCHEALD